ncbi:MAG: hypothetical protein EXR69_06350 [Myxococcales bacterium]|nr:hypothetical protein [Myxococcales bacterium]
MLAALVVVMLLPQAMAIAPIVRELPHGMVNWTTLDLCSEASQANSSGSMAGYEALEGRARAEVGPLMLKLAREVRMDAGHTTGDLMGSTDAVADKLDASVSLWEVTEARYYTSGRVHIEVCLPIQAWLRPQLSRIATGADRGTPPVVPVSGLVIDARGLSVEPAINLEVRDATGVVLYSAASMTSFAASQRPIVVYVSDPADPVAVRRAGEQPVIVKAASVVDEVNLVLDDEGAASLREAAGSAGFLAQGTVVVVLDR